MVGGLGVTWRHVPTVALAAVLLVSVPLLLLCGATREEVYGPGGVRALGGDNAVGVHGEGPTQGCGPRARTERTKNICCMCL